MDEERRRRAWHRLLGHRLLPVVLLGVIFAADAVLTWVRLGTSSVVLVFHGLVDWSGHLSTALLVLLAVCGAGFLARHRVFTIAACLASFGIDLDHIPLYAGVPGVAVEGGRPFTHSLLTVVVLAAVWLASRGRWVVFGGLAVGVALHFVRDIATGPGLSLWWPLSSRRELLPYWVYAAAMIVLTAVAVARASTTRRDRPTAGPRASAPNAAVVSD